MSRSNPQLTNPAEHFFEWAGSKGELTWYDKENKKNVQVRLPFEFLVIDELSTITGYSKIDQSGFWSNEVRNVKKDELFVRTKKGPFEAGLYENLTQTRSKGGKYAKSVYLIHKIGDRWAIGCLKAHGSALSAWIEFSKTVRVENGKVQISRGEQQEAPTGAFYPPVFKYLASSDDEDTEAIRLDKELQIYLSQYLSAPKVADDGYSSDTPETTVGATADDVADFEDRKVARGMTPAKRAEPVLDDDFSDEPINLDDIPF